MEKSRLNKEGSGVYNKVDRQIWRAGGEDLISSARKGHQGAFRGGNSSSTKNPSQKCKRDIYTKTSGRKETRTKNIHHLERCIRSASKK